MNMKPSGESNMAMEHSLFPFVLNVGDLSRPIKQFVLMGLENMSMILTPHALNAAESKCRLRDLWGSFKEGTMNAADRENLHSSMGASNSHLESIDHTLGEILQLLKERNDIQTLIAEVERLTVEQLTKELESRYQLIRFLAKGKKP